MSVNECLPKGENGGVQRWPFSSGKGGGGGELHEWFNGIVAQGGRKVDGVVWGGGKSRNYLGVWGPGDLFQRV